MKQSCKNVIRMVFSILSTVADIVQHLLNRKPAKAGDHPAPTDTENETEKSDPKNERTQP